MCNMLISILGSSVRQNGGPSKCWILELSGFVHAKSASLLTSVEDATGAAVEYVWIWHHLVASAAVLVCQVRHTHRRHLALGVASPRTHISTHNQHERYTKTIPPHIPQMFQVRSRNSVCTLNPRVIIELIMELIELLSFPYQLYQYHLIF